MKEYNKKLLKSKLKYMIYNDDTLTIKEFDCLDDAKHFAINYCDHSHEILVRQVDWLGLKLKDYVDLTDEIIMNK